MTQYIVRARAKAASFLLLPVAGDGSVLETTLAWMIGKKAVMLPQRSKRTR